MDNQTVQAIETIQDGAGAVATRPQYESNPMGTFGFFLIFLVIFYFFMIRPQQQREKERKAKISALKKGDKIITAGGLIGKVQEIKEDYFSVKLSNDVSVSVAKDYVSPYQEAENAPKAEKA